MKPKEYLILNCGLYRWAAPRKVALRGLINRFEDLPHFINSKRGSSRIKYGMTPLYNNGGFTLIELLVVVLIIGVLTAVAVPMYKHATIKSQFSAVMPPTKSLADAQEVFYLNNGEYAEDKDELDLSIPDTAQTTVNVSTKRNYKYVMGHHTGVPGANYIVYQKNSKRFSGNVHCEAAKTDDNAKWLCEKGLGGTPITGSISGNNYATYLLSGNAGSDKFLREDCAAGYYDNNGTCTTAPKGYYADEGELKICPTGTYQNAYGSTDCELCPAGTFNRMWGQKECYVCDRGTYNDTEGNTGCLVCDKGTYQPEYGGTSCIPCPAGTNAVEYRSRECTSCREGYYSTGGAIYCTKCPSGQTSNADHTGCVSM